MYRARAVVPIARRHPVGGCNGAAPPPHTHTRAAGAKVWALAGRPSRDVPKLVPFVACAAVVVFAPKRWLGQLSVLADAVEVYADGRDAGFFQLPFGWVVVDNEFISTVSAQAPIAGSQACECHTDSSQRAEKGSGVADTTRANVRAQCVSRYPPPWPAIRMDCHGTTD